MNGTNATWDGAPWDDAVPSSFGLFIAAMVLLAACVSLRPPRQRGTMLLVGIGITAGFIVFFVGSFLQALGASHQIPVFLAAWAPTLITFLLGLSVMLTLEDG